MNELKELFEKYNLKIDMKEDRLSDLKKITNAILFDDTNINIYIEGFLDQQSPEKNIAHIIFFEYIQDGSTYRHFIVVNHHVSEEKLMRIRKIKNHRYDELHQYKNNPNMLSRHLHIKRENILMTGKLTFDDMDRFYYSLNRYHEETKKTENTYIQSLVLRIKTIMETHYFTYDKLRVVAQRHQAEEKILNLLNQHEIPEHKFKVLLKQNSYLKSFYESHLLRHDLQKKLTIKSQENKAKL